MNLCVESNHFRFLLLLLLLLPPSVLPSSAVLSHVLLNEKLHVFGWLGCVLCVTGSTTIVLHAPPERPIESVRQLWDLAMDPCELLTQ